MLKRAITFLLILLAVLLTVASAGILFSSYTTEAASLTPAVTVLAFPVETDTLNPAKPAPDPSSTPLPTATIPPTHAAMATETNRATLTPTIQVTFSDSDFAAILQGGPPGANPLTGLVLLDPGRLERRPLAIKIPNFPRAVRPQSGLSRADIVYEYYLEQGITRFIGIFYGQDAEKAGPVRSGRFFDEHVFRMYEAIFAFSGADDRVLEYFMTLEKEIVNRLVLEHPQDRERTCREGVSVPLCRDRHIAGYNNMFADTAALSRYITERGTDNSRPDLAGMRFEERRPLGGEPGTSIDFNYSFFSYSRWTYNPSSGRYLRFQDTQDETAAGERSHAPLLDSLTDQVIAADNVVALLVPHDYYLKSSDTEIVQINLAGVGPATLFRDGFAYPAQWVRPSEGVLILLSQDGRPFPLKPGVTFYQVLGASSLVGQDQGEWTFDFQIP